MLRPDYALQLYLRTMNRVNVDRDPVYMTVVSAIQELKRLYKMEMFAKDLVETLEESDIEFGGRVLVNVDMIQDVLKEASVTQSAE